MPTYVGGMMALGWATDNEALAEIPLSVLKVRFEKIEGTMLSTHQNSQSLFCIARFCNETLRPLHNPLWKPNSVSLAA